MQKAGAEICAAISKHLLPFLGAGEGTRRGKSCFQTAVPLGEGGEQGMV